MTDQRLFHAASVLNDPAAFAIYMSLLMVFPGGATEDEIRVIQSHWRIGRSKINTVILALKNAGLLYTWIPADEKQRPVWREKIRVAV